MPTDMASTTCNQRLNVDDMKEIAVDNPMNTYMEDMDDSTDMVICNWAPRSIDPFLDEGIHQQIKDRL